MDSEEFIFDGCKFLKYDGDMSVPRQGINIGRQKSLCYARFNADGVLDLVQYCKRGRMNYPEAGITRQCCSDFETITHKITVPIWELDSSPRDFMDNKEKIEKDGER